MYNASEGLTSQGTYGSLSWLSHGKYKEKPIKIRNMELPLKLIKLLLVPPQKTNHPKSTPLFSTKN